MSESVIQTRDLQFSYGRKQVLRRVNLDVPAGSIFGFLGRNGAGKTTTIQHLLGLLKPRSGQCYVNGIDPQADPIAVRQAVGYMAEDQTMYAWMRIRELIQWTSNFYPTWDQEHVDDLLDRFELSGTSKVKTLSKGQNSRLALLLALAHRPRVVILDDPTLGLDPIARREFLRNVIKLLQADGVTVFFSSHLLYEIEPITDQIAILDQGTIIKTGSTESLRECVRRFVFVPAPETGFQHLSGILDANRRDETLCLTIDHCDDDLRNAVKQMAQTGVQELGLNLDEIFEAYVIGNRGQEVALC
jgi:ABC-2 type transport system ATP-binding protein